MGGGTFGNGGIEGTGNGKKNQGKLRNDIDKVRGEAKQVRNINITIDSLHKGDNIVSSGGGKGMTFEEFEPFILSASVLFFIPLLLFNNANISNKNRLIQIFMQEKSLIKQNILQFIDYKGITKYRFYQETGITRGILDQNNGMSEENTSRFLTCYPEVNVEWLITRKGEMLKPNVKKIPHF